MARLGRLESCGATFSDKLDSLADLKNRGFTVNGNPTVVTGGPRGRNVIKFDGTTDSISMPDSSANYSMNFSGGGSISAWVYFDALGGSAPIIGTADNIGTSISYGWMLEMVNVATDQKYFQLTQKFATGLLRESNRVTTLVTGQWYHVVVTYNSSSTSNHPSFYVNGTLLASNFSSTQGTGAATNATTNLYIAGASAIAATLTGRLSNVMYFNRTLTAAEVTNLYNGTTFNYEDNLVSRWDLSEINPQDVGYKGNGNNGTGTSIVVGNIVDGQNGRFKAFDLDGAADYVSITKQSSFTSVTKPGTISAWINYDVVPVTKGAIEVIMDISGSGSNGIIMYGANSNGTIVMQVGNGSATNTAASTTVPVAGIWYHVAATWDSSNLSFYLNGVLEATTSNANLTANFVQATAYIGSQTGTQRFFDGKISDVRIYNTALSNFAIRDIYQRTR